MQLAKEEFEREFILAECEEGLLVAAPRTRTRLSRGTRHLWYRVGVATRQRRLEGLMARPSAINVSSVARARSLTPRPLLAPGPSPRITITAAALAREVRSRDLSKAEKS